MRQLDSGVRGCGGRGVGGIVRGRGSPGKKQQEGQEDQGTLKQPWGSSSAFILPSFFGLRSSARSLAIHIKLATSFPQWPYKPCTKKKQWKARDFGTVRGCPCSCFTSFPLLGLVLRIMFSRTLQVCGGPSPLSSLPRSCKILKGFIAHKDPEYLRSPHGYVGRRVNGPIGNPSSYLNHSNYPAVEL